MILAAVLVFASSAANAADFSDTLSHWARNEISILSDKGIVNGVGGGMFDPDGEVTRAQYLKMLMETLGIQVSPLRTGECLDAAASDWFAPYLQGALDKGLIPKEMIVGYKALVDIERNSEGEAIGSSVRYAGAFNGNVSISREEAAYLTMTLSQYVLNASTMSKLAATDIDNYTFLDETDISGWTLMAVKLAAANGIINGMDTGKFEPAGTTTRAQAAVMINRLLNKLA